MKRRWLILSMGMVICSHGASPLPIEMEGWFTALETEVTSCMNVFWGGFLYEQGESKESAQLKEPEQKMLALISEETETDLDEESEGQHEERNEIDHALYEAFEEPQGEEQKKEEEVSGERFRELRSLEARMLLMQDKGDARARGRIPNSYIKRAEEGLRKRGYVVTKENQQQRFLVKKKARLDFKKSECRECRRVISANALFNHMRSHVAYKLHLEAGGNPADKAPRFYYDQARILLSGRKGDVKS